MKKTIILTLLGLSGLLFVMTSASADASGSTAPSGAQQTMSNQAETQKPTHELDEHHRRMHRMRERRMHRRMARARRMRLERRHRARVRRRMRRRERREHEGHKAMGQTGAKPDATPDQH